MIERKPGEITTIVVHCSDTESGDVRTIRRFHIEKGWEDIGYHFVIRRDGEIEVGRPLEFVGAHVQGANTPTIGICLIGKTDFAEAQFASLRKLIRTLRWALGPLEVRGHREFPSARAQGKTCPNFDVREVVNSTMK